jgi:RNA polymerase sigma factor (sigma-70 family)
MADDVGSSHARTDSGELSDAELVRASREGSRRAYAALWARHAPSTLRFARSLSASDADDLVSEAFLKVYAAIRAGRGPETDFRFYLRAAVRNTYVSMVRARRTTAAGDAFEDMIGDDGAEAATVLRFEGSATARAFMSLPQRWQQVLWYSEVEGRPREQIAALLQMNPNAVSALAFRAREALRTAWVQQHVSTHTELDAECEAVSALLGAHSRQTLPRRDRVRTEQHLNQCARCSSVSQELSELLTPGRLAMALLPVLVIGSGGVIAYGSHVAAGTTALASASTPLAATVFAGVGGTAGAASTGAAALSVVGKVAACALIAGVVAAPVPGLIEPFGTPPDSHRLVLEASADRQSPIGEESEAGRSESAPAPDSTAAEGPASDDRKDAARGTEHETTGSQTGAEESDWMPEPAGQGSQGTIGNGQNGGNKNGPQGNGSGNSSTAADPGVKGNSSANANASAATPGNSSGNANAAMKGNSSGNVNPNSAAQGNSSGIANPNSVTKGNSSGNANANSAAQGNSSGNANANANSATKGNSSGNANANSAAQGNSSGNANANSTTNGNGNGNGKVTAGGDSAAPSSSAPAVAGQDQAASAEGTAPAEAAAAPEQ